MIEVRTAHTADLDAGTLTAVRALLHGVFDGEFEEVDWEHSCGGMHAIAWDGAEPVGHAAVVQRRLLYRGRALRSGHVEGVGVRADRRGGGVAGLLMAEIERIVRGAYEVGALGATDMAAPLYARRGWQRWLGPTSALTPGGVVRTPDDDGGVYVLPVSVTMDLTGELTCDWREGDGW